MKRSNKKSFFVIFAIILSCGLLAVLLGFFSKHSNGPKDAGWDDESYKKLASDLDAFEDATRRYLERAASLEKKAASFRQEEALASLAPGERAAFFYRFDDNLAQATVSEETGPGQREESARPMLAFEFDGDDDPKLRSEGDGNPVFEGSAASTLESTGAMAIDPKDVGEIEISARASKPAKLFLGWCKSDTPYDKATKIQKGLGFISIRIEPSEEFRTYRILASAILKNRKHLQPGDLIRKIYFRATPTAGGEGRTEIDYLRFYSKKRKYARMHAGTDTETLNLQMRKVLFTNAPSDIKYSMRLPSGGETTLSFGMGLLQENAPTKFAVIVQSDGGSETIFEKTIEQADKWYDEEMDLSNWNGKEIAVHLTVESERSNVAFWSNPVAFQRPGEKLNVIVLLEDAFRAGNLSINGYKRATTPIKDALFEKGVNFLNAFSQAPRTRPSVPTILTSMHTTATGVWRHEDFLSANYLTMAEILRGQGFATASFVQNSNAGPGAGLHQGFSFLYDHTAIGERAETAYGDKMFAFLKRGQKRNFFAFVHLLDPHSPYDPPPPFDKYFKGALGKLNRYDGEIRYNDDQFEKLLDKLKQYELLDDTLVVFISDHGEYMGEHGLWKHRPPGYVQGLNVPMLVYYPKAFPAGRVFSQPVQLVDVMPTVLEMAGVETRDLVLQGDSLLSLINGEKPGYWKDRISISEERIRRTSNGSSRARGSVFFRDWHALTSRLKIGGESKRRTATVLFDVAKDRAEETPLVLKKSDRLYKLLKHFQNKLLDLDRSISRHFRADFAEGAAINPVEEEQLRALGYID